MKHTARRIYASVFVFGFIGLVYGCVLFRTSPAKLFESARKNRPYDVVIVPGVPFDGTSWSRIMKGRVVWSSYLLKEGIAKNVIYSGAAVYTPYVEAKIMALYGEALGIPKENIFTESQAQHSTENVYYAYHLAKKLGFTKIALATDPGQSAMLRGFTKRRFKLPIAHIPFVIDTMAVIDKVNPVIIPQSAYVNDFKSIVETQSTWQRLKGTLGKNIAFERE